MTKSLRIIDDLLSTINYETEVKGIYQGPFQTAVETRYCGLASTPHELVHSRVRKPVEKAGLLMNETARELANLAKSESLFEASIGMAAINSLVEVSEEKCQEINAGDLIAQKGAGKNVAVVGHFPFIEKLRNDAKELWVIEKNPREGDKTEADAKYLIPEADVVGITGTALTNHTIGQLLELCNPKAYVVLIGGTAPLSRLFFDYNVNAISGTKVIDSETVIRSVMEGATYRQIKGIRQLTLLKV